MQIGILSSVEGWHFNDLQRASRGQYELVRFAYQDLHASIDDRGETVSANGRSLESLDGILVRAMPAGSLEQVVARMDMLFRLERLDVSVINPAKSIEAAVDKYLCLTRLKDAGIAVPRSAVFQRSEPAVDFFEQLDSVAVSKPIFGSEGRGIVLLDSAALAQTHIQAKVHEQKAVFLQEYLAHPLREIRLFVVGEHVFSMSRQHDGDWRKNVSLGATPLPYQATESERKLAIRAAQAVGTCIAGVDLIIDSEGKAIVLEVNSSPGWQHLSRTLSHDIAAEILNYMATCICRRRNSGVDQPR